MGFHFKASSHAAYGNWCTDERIFHCTCQSMMTNLQVEGLFFFCFFFRSVLFCESSIGLSCSVCSVHRTGNDGVHSVYAVGLFLFLCEGKVGLGGRKLPSDLLHVNICLSKS